MKGHIVAGLALALMCGGCVTAAEQRSFDEDRCRSYGFRTGSDAFAQCLLQVDLDRAADRRARFNDFAGGPWPYDRRW